MPELRQTLLLHPLWDLPQSLPGLHPFGGHAYGFVYPGPIGEILTPQMEGLDAAGVLATASSLVQRLRRSVPGNDPDSAI
jgi:L-lactate dehydrogenase complex protein LldF